MERLRTPLFLALLALLFAAGTQERGCTVPVDVSPSPAPSTITSVTYVYEQRDGSVPPTVLSAINRINREQQITATTFDKDTLDGGGQVPDQYKIPLAAANEAGLPALIVLAGEKVVRVVKAPTTEEEVLKVVVP